MGVNLSRRAISGAAYLTAGTIVQAVIGLIASIVLARVIGPEAFGRFAMVFAVVGLTQSVLSLRLPVLITRASDAEISGAAGRIYCSALVMETGLGAAASLIFLVLVGIWDVWALALVVSQAVAHWTGGNRAFYERSMPYRRLAVMETATAIGGHLLAMSAAVAGAGEAALYLRELAMSFGLVAVLAASGGLTLLPWRGLSAREGFALIREARSIWLDGILEGSFQRLATLAVSMTATERETGYFFMAQSLAMRPHQFLAPIASRVAANWFRITADPVTRRKGRNLLLLWLAGPLVACAVFVVWFSDPVVPMILGEQWRGAVPVLVAMSGIIVCLTAFEVLRSYSLVVRRERCVVHGRIAQYLGFLAVSALGQVALPGVVAIGLGVSASFLAASLLLWLLLARDTQA